jgi:hypothetical protein
MIRALPNDLDQIAELIGMSWRVQDLDKWLSGAKGGRWI